MKEVQRRVRFVKFLFRNPRQRRERSIVFCSIGNQRVSLPEKEVDDLISHGVLAQDHQGALRVLPEAKSWMKRLSLEVLASSAAADGVAASPRLENDTIARLSRARETNGETFLKPHHIQAAQRIAKLISRGQLRPGVTQNFSALTLTKTKGAPSLDISDFALDNRRELYALLGILPKDCARVVLDVCGFEKGLQAIEFELGWPRRSAKLILRMALDHAASFWRIDDMAVGRAG